MSIWAGDTNASGTGNPPRDALTPPREVGHVDCSEAFAFVPAAARFDPKTDAALPGVTGAVKLAEFKTATTQGGEEHDCAANEMGIANAATTKKNESLRQLI